jgi:tetratricopeptide (TPR) repeat protein
VDAFIETAQTELGRASEKMDQASEGFDEVEGSADFETGPILSHLDEADAALEAAEGNATDEQRETIDALAATSEWLRTTTEALDDFATMMTHVETGLDHFDNNRFEDAIAALQDGQTAREDVSDQLVIANDRLESIDTDRLSDVDEFDFGSVRSSFEELDNAVDTMEYFISGFVDMVRGFRDFFPAATAYDEGEYADATGGFVDARDHFVTARSTFEEGEAVAETDIESSIMELTCLAGAMRDGADQYRTAAEAAEMGNTDEAEQAVERAENAIDRCDTENAQRVVERCLSSKLR